MRTQLLLGGCLFLSVSQLQAQPTTQNVVNSTGHSYKGTFYQVDWSIGELALVNEMKGSKGALIVTNGFLQSTESTILNNESRFSDEEIRVLPNITVDVVDVNLLTRQQGKVQLQVVDVNGRVVFRRSLTGYGSGHVERLSLRPLASGTYFLKIDLDPAPGSVKKTGSYKIVKL